MAEACRFSGVMFHVHAPTEGHLEAFFTTLIESIDDGLDRALQRHPKCYIVEEEDDESDS